MILNVKSLTTPQLLAIRKILVDGALATSETKKAKELREVKAENARLEREKKVRGIVESHGLEFDSPEYWMGLDKSGVLEFVCARLETAMKIGEEAEAAAEKLRTKIPPVFLTAFDDEISPLDTVRKELKRRRNGGSEDCE